jgi:hypothetical protein
VIINNITINAKTIANFGVTTFNFVDCIVLLISFLELALIGCVCIEDISFISLGRGLRLDVLVFRRDGLFRLLLILKDTLIACFSSGNFDMEIFSDFDWRVPWKVIKLTSIPLESKRINLWKFALLFGIFQNNLIFYMNFQNINECNPTVSYIQH